MRRRNPARWRAIEGRLGREHNIWLATVRADGRPHLVPIWFVWFDGFLYVCTTPDTQKYQNLIHNQMVSLALPDPNQVLILEGEAHVADKQTIEIIADQFYYKYEWDFRYDEASYRLIEITLHKILAWGDGYDAEGTRVF